MEAPVLLDNIVRFLLSEIGTLSLFVGGVVSLLTAITGTPKPSSRRAKYPGVFAAMFGTLAVIPFFLYWHIRTPNPPSRITATPQFDSVAVFPVRFVVTNGPHYVYDATYRCGIDEIRFVSGAMIGNLSLLGPIEVNGQLVTGRNRFDMEPNDDNVVLRCALGLFRDQVPLEGTIVLVIEFSLRPETGRRQLEMTFDLGEDANGLPLWVLIDSDEVSVSDRPISEFRSALGKDNNLRGREVRRLRNTT